MKIGILVVAYNAERTLEAVLNRLPPDFLSRVTAILVSDDESSDRTYEVGIDYLHSAPHLPLEIVRRETNLGYGGNQKAGYRWAIDRGLDIIVLLHGDGQYAPEVIDQLVAPLEAGSADAVFGSRMLSPGAAREGGMPLYKFVGNKVLTRIQNKLAGSDLSEWHSGYRAYSVDKLRTIPFNRNSDGFDFDTEIIIQLIESGARIVEVPIPTYYGDEVCHVNGIAYGARVVIDTARYRAHRAGLGSGELAFNHLDYETKLSEGFNSSHSAILAAVNNSRPLRVLDFGCGTGEVAALLTAAGHDVLAVDLGGRPDGLPDHVQYVTSDAESAWQFSDHNFDLIIAADLIEHLRNPQRFLQQAAERLAADGRLLISVPNITHWYPRVRMISGRFDYDRRGILDATHLRFYNTRSIQKLIEESGFSVDSVDFTGTPIQVALRGAQSSNHSRRGLQLLDSTSLKLAKSWPSLFAYQVIVGATLCKTDE